MDSTPLLTHPEHVYSRRRMASIAFGAVALGLSFTSGMLLADRGVAPSTTTIIEVPVAKVEAPPIELPAIEPPTVVDPVGYRATAPRLQIECIGVTTADAPNPACAWDDGFPAISADGKTVVEARIPDLGERDGTGLHIVFFDVATSKVTRTVVVLDPDDAPYGEPLPDKVRATLVKRATAVQQELDAKKFRSLVELLPPGNPTMHEAATPAPGIHAEVTGQVMRLVDADRGIEMWRHEWSAPAPRKLDPDAECSAWYMAELGVSWDPETHVVFGQLLYHHGGCMCGSTQLGQVFTF